MEKRGRKKTARKRKGVKISSQSELFVRAHLIFLIEQSFQESDHKPKANHPPSQDIQIAKVCVIDWAANRAERKLSRRQLDELSTPRWTSGNRDERERERKGKRDGGWRFNKISSDREGLQPCKSLEDPAGNPLTLRWAAYRRGIPDIAISLYTLSSTHEPLPVRAGFYLASHTRQREWLKRGREWSWTWSRSAWIHPLSFFFFFLSLHDVF